MKIFLTGGTGFIGQALTRELISRGWEVNALVRNPDGPQAQALTSLGAQCMRGNVTDRQSMRSAMTGADIVIHNAGHYELGVDSAGKKNMQAVNVLGTENVLGLALELGIARTLYVSTTQAYGDSGPQLHDETFERNAPCRTMYERTKTDAHAIALEYQRRGLPLVIACPNGVIGPNDHSVWGYAMRLHINRMMPPMSPRGDACYSLVEVNDLVRGLALAAEKGRPGETYFLCGETRNLREHFALIQKYPGAFKIAIWLPVWLAKLLFMPLEPLQRAAGLPAIFSQELVDTATTNFNYSSEKAQKELGWSHRSAEEMWDAAYNGELELLSKRQKRGIVSRLNPLVSEG